MLLSVLEPRSQLCHLEASLLVPRNLKVFMHCGRTCFLHEMASVRNAAENVVSGLPLERVS